MMILNVSWKNGVFQDRGSWSADLLPSADVVLILTTACGCKSRGICIGADLLKVAGIKFW